MVQEARDFYRFVLALGRHKSSLLHPEVSSDQGDGVGEGRAGLVIPRRGARRHATLLTDPDIRRQRHHAEPAKERGGGTGDGSFRPLALGFHAQVSPQLLKEPAPYLIRGHLDLPPQQIPLQYPQGFRLGVGA